MAKPKFIILFCDGGGVRGLITAMLLESLDAKFLQNVSLFAGTSTGSIIALGLAAEYRSSKSSSCTARCRIATRSFRPICRCPKRAL
jgi:patatin-like phospholipase/acyl hydrolase